jgi:hypothetical protein
MRKIIVALFLVALMASPAFADIVNGGFESGTFTGWSTSGTTAVVGVGTDPRANNMSTVGVIGSTFSAKVGDETAYGFSGPANSSISQTFMAGVYNDLYFAWAAVANVPVGGSYHTIAETPWFQVKVEKSGVGTPLLQQEFYSGSPDPGMGGIVPGWLLGNTGMDGSNSPGDWYYRPWTTFDLNYATYGIAATDILTITLTTRDCTQSGHSSYAYLDGFGYTAPPIGTPEPATMLLLGLGLVGLAGVRRKIQK